MESCLGIVCARAGSKRLPLKNILKINGKSLVDRAQRTLFYSGIEKIILATDIEDFKDRDNLLERPVWLNQDDTPLQDVVRYVVERKREREKYAVVLMPNAPMITPHHVSKALTMLGTNKFKIVRSYDASGCENGLYAFDIDYFLYNSYQYDVYTGSIQAEGIEIHTYKDFEYCRDRIGRFTDDKYIPHS